MFCARHFFRSQVFKTTSNVLNSDVNIVNIALIAFCSLAVTNDSCVTNYRPASNPHESKGGEIRYKILRFGQHCFVASFGSMFRVFHLA